MCGNARDVRLCQYLALSRMQTHTIPRSFSKPRSPAAALPHRRLPVVMEPSHLATIHAFGALHASGTGSTFPLLGHHG